MGDLARPYYSEINPIWNKWEAEKDLKKEKESIKWNKIDAERALIVERKCERLLSGTYLKEGFKKHLTLKLLEPELDEAFLKNFHPDIERICIPHIFTPRYCYIELKENADPNEIKNQIEKFKLGDRRMLVQINETNEEIATAESLEAEANFIDPLCLYVENLPHDFSHNDFSILFPKHSFIKLGRFELLQNTTPVLVYFNNCDDAIATYKSKYNYVYKAHRLRIKFRRIDRREDSCWMFKRPKSKTVESDVPLIEKLKISNTEVINITDSSVESDK